jgi:hypothetical protein
MFTGDLEAFDTGATATVNSPMRTPSTGCYLGCYWIGDQLSHGYRHAAQRFVCFSDASLYATAPLVQDASPSTVDHLQSPLKGVSLYVRREPGQGYQSAAEDE